jgi:hypothetical protein
MGEAICLGIKVIPEVIELSISTLTGKEDNARLDFGLVIA